MQCMYAMPWHIFLYESYVIDLLEDSSPVFDFMYPGTHTVIHFTRPWHRAWGEFNNADGADPEAELACELLADYAHGVSQAIIYHSCIFIMGILVLYVLRTPSMISIEFQKISILEILLKLQSFIDLLLRQKMHIEQPRLQGWSVKFGKRVSGTHDW